MRRFNLMPSIFSTPRTATPPESAPQPIDKAAPCGPCLEYDPEYAVLRSRLAPRGEVQYGSFVSTSDAPQWAEIERDCRHLLQRSHDINLLVWLCRACTNLRQAAGLVQATGLLAQALQAWPEAIHPQLVIEGELDPAVRANALAALADPEGLLGDVRGIAVAANSVMRLHVRDVERAFAVPRPADALAPDSVARQLAALCAAGGADAPVHLLAQAAQRVQEIDAWCASHLGDQAPSLQPLVRLLAPFANAAQPRPRPATDAAHASSDGQGRAPPSIEAMPKATDHAATRDAVVTEIRAARSWFEQHEPSSPVAVLLKQAERLAGRRFSEVVDAIPLELLRRWDGEDDLIHQAQG